MRIYLEISLLRVRFTLLSHVIRCGLAEMQSANGNFRDLGIYQFDTAGDTFFYILLSLLESN